MPEIIKRHNHYVPEMYLMNWAKEKKVFTYQLLVPHVKVPIWKAKSVEYTASIDNMYVRQANGEELDDFEEEFMRNYETPAKNPLMKACNDQPLTENDWNALIDLLAAQIVRTPSFYFRAKEIAKKEMPGILTSLGHELNTLSAEQIIEQEKTYIKKENFFPITIEIKETAEDQTYQNIEIGAVVGKSTWLSTIKHALASSCSVLHQHTWGIITAADGVIWPTSDDPVICVNHRRGGHYDFQGSWDKSGNEIIMPICPTKAIYTKIGTSCPPRATLNYTNSYLLKRVIVEHALINIYSVKKDHEVVSIRPRTVDLEEYQRIKRENEKWYDNYQKKEVPFLQPEIERKNK